MSVKCQLCRYRDTNIVYIRFRYLQRSLDQWSTINNLLSIVKLISQKSKIDFLFRSRGLKKVKSTPNRTFPLTIINIIRKGKTPTFISRLDHFIFYSSCYYFSIKPQGLINHNDAATFIYFMLLGYQFKINIRIVIIRVVIILY